MEQMQSLQEVEHMLRHLLAKVQEMQLDAGVSPGAPQPAGVPQPAGAQPAAEYPPAGGDAGAAAHVTQLVGNEKTAVQILQEKKAQGSLTMSKPTYLRNQNEMWSCTLTVNGNLFERTAARRRDAYQLCATAALIHLGM
jgi:hypothetical protein